MTEPLSLEPLSEDWERGLAVVAHPDDLEYGSAGAIARWTDQGKDMAYLLVTRGEAGIDGMAPEEAGPVRAEEERRSARVVGVESVEFLDYQDGVVEYGLPLRRDIARAIRRQRPEIIISLNYQMTWGGPSFNMADHRNVGLALLDASRDAANRWIFPELLAEGLEPWNGVRMVCFNGSPTPTHFVDVSETIERGIASLKEHAAYLAGLNGGSDPSDFLRRMAASLGEQCGCQYAVAYQVFQF